MSIVLRPTPRPCADAFEALQGSCRAEPASSRTVSFDRFRPGCRRAARPRRARNGLSPPPRMAPVDPGPAAVSVALGRRAHAAAQPPPGEVQPTPSRLPRRFASECAASGGCSGLSSAIAPYYRPRPAQPPATRSHRYRALPPVPYVTVALGVPSCACDVTLSSLPERCDMPPGSTPAPMFPICPERPPSVHRPLSGSGLFVITRRRLTSRRRWRRRAARTRLLFSGTCSLIAPLPLPLRSHSPGCAEAHE